ncbi:unnamed protein product [marine sediment metagenome]|uniref:Uncharacterized protein n=1 Tax=marine sediment metagenome TaxID=412755 RepID=X1ND28_9ZZZZ
MSPEELEKEAKEEEVKKTPEAKKEGKGKEIKKTPNPTSGYLEIVRENDIIRTNISIDDALKMVLSAGKVSLKEVTDRLGAEN